MLQTLSQTDTITLPIKIARAFKPLLGPARYKGAHGGRGSGKSHFFADQAVKDSINQPGLRTVCVREVQRSLKESVKLLIEDKIKGLDEFRSLRGMFNVLHDRIQTPGDGLIIFQGMADHTAESVKSLEGFGRAYGEESQTLTKRSLELLRPTIRAPQSELWFSWNPRSPTDPIDMLLRGENPPPDSVVVEANYQDNPFFPGVLEEERAFDEQFNRERYAHIWDGAYEPMAIGAIWNRQEINQYRQSEQPELNRIVVAVDPAISAEEGSNEHGIIVVALGEDGRGYVLEDGSLKGSPRQWANRTVAMFDKWEADAIVIEINQGGDMVRHTIKSVRPTLPIKEVRATKGKHVRAEPISALYSLGRISHVGAFPYLEDQMCLMTAAGYEGEGSPDRVDALVWGFTELFPKLTRKTEDNKGHEPAVHMGAGGWMT